MNENFTFNDCECRADSKDAEMIQLVIDRVQDIRQHPKIKAFIMSCVQAGISPEKIKEEVTKIAIATLFGCDKLSAYKKN